MLRLKSSLLSAILVIMFSPGLPEVTQDSTYIIISRVQKKIQLYCGDSILHEYPIAVGKKDTPTPLGTYSIINKIPNPTWYPKGSDPIEPGKENPLGTCWMGLSLKGYGIHGTNVPQSIGKEASHGCIRMKKMDLEELFQMVLVGTSVTIIDTQTTDSMNVTYSSSTENKVSTVGTVLAYSIATTPWIAQ